MIAHYLTAYRQAMQDTNRDVVLETVQNAFDNGISAEDIVFQIVMPTIEYIFSSMLKQEAALSQHFVTARISEEVVNELLPMFEKVPRKGGAVILGCAFGDFHGLGKKIVAGCLRAGMFDVIDLGVSVSAERFVETAVEQRAQIIGVSSMMVHTALSDDGPKKVRRILHAEGLEHTIKLIVGGAPYKFKPELSKKAGADTWAKDGVDAIEKIKYLLKELHS